MANEQVGLAIGDIPTWILACVGVATLIAAVGAWRSSLKLLAVEQGRDEQGEQISAWAEPDVRDGYAGAYFFAGVKAVVRNPSKLPIYRVHICWEKAVVPPLSQSASLTWEEFKTEDRDLVSPDSSAYFPLDVENFEKISGEVGSASSMSPEETTINFAQDIANRVRVSVSFTDAMGQKWHRQSDGKLLKVGAKARRRWKPRITN